MIYDDIFIAHINTEVMRNYPHPKFGYVWYTESRDSFTSTHFR